MARNTDHLAGKFETAKTGGLLNGFLAEEPALDRRLKLRLGFWGLAAFAFVGAAMISSQSPVASWRDLAGDLMRQSQQIQLLTKESQNETRRLASAIDTLNGDRDRLYSRITVLEQGLDSVTGTLARQNSATAWPEAEATPQLPPMAPSPESVQAVAPTAAAPAGKPEIAAMGQQASATTPAQAAAATSAAPPPASSPVPAHASPAPPVAATAAKSAPAAGSLYRQNAVPAPPQVTSTGSLTPEPSSPPQNPGPAPRVAPVATTAPKPATLALARQSSATASSQAAAPPSPATEAASASPNPSTGQLSSHPATMATKAAERPPMDTTDQGPATVSSATPMAASMSAASPATPLMASQSLMAPPDAAAAKLTEPEKSASASPAGPPPPVSSASTEPEPSPTTPSKPVIQRTEFAVDVGGASSVSGLRAMWRGLMKSNAALSKLDPIIVVREGSGGLGMQLRLVAGPLDDAAAAAKICAALTESERPCEPTVFDGQRLAMKSDEPSPTDAKAATPKPAVHRKSNYFRHGTPDEAAKKPEVSSLSAFFGRR